MPHDHRLAIGYGSAWHLLRLLGWQRERFNTQIANGLRVQGLDPKSISWLDFTPATGQRTYSSNTPIRDEEWKRIAFINDKQVRSEYDKFWPSRGAQQSWDAIGQVTINGAKEWLLVEAKGHLGEIKTDGTSAKEEGGRPCIRATFQETLRSLGKIDPEVTTLAEEWLTGYYQHANRLATLHFLTKQKIPARLIFLYFCGDQHPRPGVDCPAVPAGWKPAINAIHESLGLGGVSELKSRVHEVFIPVDPAHPRIQ